MNAETISSLQNQRVKDAVKLRDRRTRDKLQRIIIDGVREIDRALDADVTLVEVFYCTALCETVESQQLLRRIAATSTPRFEVTAAVFTKLAFGERAEGIVAVAETPRRSLDDLRLHEDALVAVLERVEKPGNLGAVLRSADGAGVSAVILADAITDVFNPNAIRASLGTIFRMQICTATSEETLQWLRKSKLSIFATRVDGATPYSDVNLAGASAIVLGSEAEGLTGRWSASDVTAIRLPMLGAADSLNVSVTAGILFYEALRQRTHRRA